MTRKAKRKGKTEKALKEKEKEQTEKENIKN